MGSIDDKVLEQQNQHPHKFLQLQQQNHKEITWLEIWIIIKNVGWETFKCNKFQV